jgi:hypothetical protein
MTPTYWCPVTLTPTNPRPLHPIRQLLLLTPRHPIMRPIKAQIPNPIMPLHPSSLLQPHRQIPRHLPKDPNLPFNNLLHPTVLHMSRHILHKPFLRPVVENPLPQRTRSHEILFADLGQERDGVAGEVAVHFIQVDGPLAEADGLDARDVVGARALVEERHAAIALEVRHAVIDARCVNRQLLIIHADAMTVCVWVRKETGLQDWVGGGFDTWGKMRWVEGYLLDFCEVVFGVFVEGEFAHFSEGELFVGPDVGEVEDVDLCFSQSSSASLALMVCTSRLHFG